MNTFGYSAEKINEIIKNNDLKKVCMKGVDKDLRKLKPVIEKYMMSIFFILIIGLLNVCILVGIGMKTMEK